jgi:hypothetical protein
MSGRKSNNNSSSSSSAALLQVVDDEEDTAQQSEMTLTDITAMKTSSQESGQNTAIKKFNEMIMKVGDQIFGDDDQLSFEHIPATKWNKDGKKMMGLFADYMRQEGLSLSANLGYCSAIKTHLVHKMENELNEGMFPGGKGIWYTQLRSNITKAYIEACSKSNTAVAEHAPQMTEEDLLLVVSVLIDTSGIYAVADRCVLVMQWYLLGRISEMYNLSLRQLCYNPELCAVVIKDFLRGKTSHVQSEIHVLIHRLHWQICPLHALASHIATWKTMETLFSEEVRRQLLCEGAPG